MANPWAGEVAICARWRSAHVAKLTLGALAELEAALETGTLIELVRAVRGGAVFARATCWR